jgi:hypothetical protein
VRLGARAMDPHGPHGVLDSDRPTASNELRCAYGSEDGERQVVTRGWGGVGRGGGGGDQIALLWMAVLAAGVKSVKLGADLVVEVAQLVPALHLKPKGSAT